MSTTGFGFPFRIDELGQVATQTGDDNVRAKILQVLLTAPGERVNLPEFGCGLRDLVFDPNNQILAATTEFTVTKALQRWVGDEIIVDSVNVASAGTDPSRPEGELQIEVVYRRRDRLEPGRLKITF